MYPIRIAIVSDLHVGVRARAPSLKMEIDLSDDKFFQSFQRLIANEIKRADYLVVPGDLTHQASPAEFERADLAVREVARMLGIKHESILFVPGNHDVNWAVAGLPHTSEIDRRFWEGLKFRPLCQSSSLFDSLQREGSRSLVEPPYFIIKQNESLVALCINSSAYETPTRTPHRGEVKQDAIFQINEMLAGLDTRGRPKILIVHHHMIQHSNSDPDLADFSIMVNAENLLRALTRARFDFVFYGHKHAPCFNIYRDAVGHPICLLCAGSFSIELDSSYNGIVNNQFHIVDIDGRGDEGTLYGVVRSWTYLDGHGWRKSREHNGIAHLHPFGRYADPNAIFEVVRPLVQRALESRSHVEWTWLVRQADSLAFLPLAQVDDVLDRVADSLGLRRLGGDTTEFVLLKEAS